MSFIISKALIVIGTIAFLTWLTVKTCLRIANHPTIGDKLKEKGYKTLFESKFDQITKWKNAYSTHAEEIKADGRKNGAQQLKNWCGQALLKPYSNNLSLFKKVEKFCTVNIKNEILDKDDAIMIFRMEKEKKKVEWENSFKKYQEKEKGSVKDVSDLKELCKSLFVLPYIPEYYPEYRKARNYCSISEIA